MLIAELTALTRSLTQIPAMPKVRTFWITSARAHVTFRDDAQAARAVGAAA